MPEWGTQPANQYLPRQRTGPLAAAGPAGDEVAGGKAKEEAR